MPAPDPLAIPYPNRPLETGLIVAGAGRWRQRQLLHELRNNFGLVELLHTGAGGCEIAFHLHAWDGRRARRAFAVRYRPGAAACYVVVAW
jgi:hypothetical protein